MPVVQETEVPSTPMPKVQKMECPGAPLRARPGRMRVLNPVVLVLPGAQLPRPFAARELFLPEGPQ